MGTTNILYTITIILALIALILFIADRKPGKSTPAIVLIIISGYLFFQSQSDAKPYIDEDTQYSRVWIYDATDQATGKPIKFMRINNESSSAMFADNDELVFPYSKYYRLAEHFTPGFRSALILGGAAFSYPKYFLEKYPDASIDVVEIDPELTQMAREYFRLKDDPRMKIFHEDARTFLNRAENRYDVIFGDAYKSLYTVPWHLTTLESAQKTYKMLNDGGCVLLNIISSIEGDASLFLQAELATYREVFPYVYVFAAMDPDNDQMVQSTILVGIKTDMGPVMLSADTELAGYLMNNVTGKIGKSLPVLTDEFAPVDYYTNKAIK